MQLQKEGDTRRTIGGSPISDEWLERPCLQFFCSFLKVNELSFIQQ
jgi:hypothetical protein